MNPIGFSTGALALGDFDSALRYLQNKPINAVELSALRVSELPPLLNAISTLNLGQFSYIAVHAPSSFTKSEEAQIVSLLTRFPENWNIVLHPDAVHEAELWQRFGHRLLIENMDRRKRDGRSAEEISHWLLRLPQAQLCFDLAHAQQWDTTMTEAYLILKKFSKRTRQVHISQLDSASRHYPLSSSSVRAFSEIAWLIPEDAPFIIESRISPTEMEAEIEKVRMILNSARSNDLEAIPA